MFNEYIWQTYLKAVGNEVASMFEENLLNDFSENYAERISEIHKTYCPSPFIAEEFKSQLFDLYNDLIDGVYLLKDGEYTISIAMDCLYNICSDNNTCSHQKSFEWFSKNIVHLTTFMALSLPELFIPYYFKYNFNILERIAKEFEIELPPIPIKKDYLGRFLYYGEICQSLYDFRQNHNMTPFELCAFLYDFAPKCIGGTDSYLKKEIPAPKSAFFIGGDATDEFLSNEPNSVSIWQCSPDAKAGDIAVMYLRTPISSVDSVWRCASDGFIDPFFYYYRCAYITNPMPIKRISQKKLEMDKVFKQLPIVRKNMQGINGVELLPSQYNYLMDMAKSEIMRLEYTVTESGIELLNEKDVENKLVKPLLQKLDYKDSDYQQQLHIEIGNHNNMVIPDFVILPDKTTGQQSAFAIIEAKFDIPNSTAFAETKIQARSYARQIIAKYSVVASKNKVWVSSCVDDFSEDIFIATWDELNNADIFSRLYKLIGKNR